MYEAIWILSCSLIVRFADSKLSVYHILLLLGRELEHTVVDCSRIVVSVL